MSTKVILLVALSVIVFDALAWLLWARPTSLSEAEANLKVATVNICICIVATIARLARIL